MKQNSISACLVVYHEEAIIRKCLESIKNVVDEIIVVHDGECHDDTLEIAKEYGALTFIRPHVGVCEGHRVFTFEKARGDWIVMIDADEALTPRLQRELRSLVSNEKIDAYAFDWPIIKNGKYIPGTYGNRYKTILFRKSKVFYIAITHESIGTYGKLVTRKDLLLEHDPQSNRPTLNSLRKRLNDYAFIEAKEILNLEKAQVYNIEAKETNPHYQYYARYRKHPLLMSYKQVMFDIWRAFTVESVFALGVKDPKVFIAMIFRNLSWLKLGRLVFYLKAFPSKIS